MTARKVRWAVNLPDGTPIIINGVIADVDDATGVISPDERTRIVIDEILKNTPQHMAMAMIPMADFAEEVHRILERRSTGGPKVKSTEPKNMPMNDLNQTSVDPFQKSIDQTLRLVYSQEYREYIKLFGVEPESPSIEEIRAGPLGRDLLRLSRIARGDDECSPDDVYNIVDSVLELLFWAPGNDYYQVPREFWDEPLGRMLSLSILQTLDPDDLMTVGEAAVLLGVTRPLVYRWMDERVLRSVRDTSAGQFLVIRKDVESLLEETQRLSENLPDSEAVVANQPDARIVVFRQPKTSNDHPTQNGSRTLLG